MEPQIRARQKKREFYLPIHKVRDGSTILQIRCQLYVNSVSEQNISVAECRTVAIGTLPLCRVVTPVYKHRDNDCTQWCDLDSDSPALSHRCGVKFKDPFFLQKCYLNFLKITISLKELKKATILFLKKIFKK